MLFLFNLLPAGFFHLILMLGLAGSMISAFMPTIPLIGQGYQILFKLISAMLLAFGLIFTGVSIANTDWTNKMHAVELAEKQHEIDAAKITSKVETVYVDKVKIVKVKGDTIVQKVPEYISVANDKQCVLPVGFVRLLNDAAQVSGSTGTANAPSNTTSNVAGATGAVKQ